MLIFIVEFTESCVQSHAGGVIEKVLQSNFQTLARMSESKLLVSIVCHSTPVRRLVLTLVVLCDDKRTATRFGILTVV
jgi:hypothetical protein